MCYLFLPLEVFKSVVLTRDPLIFIIMDIAMEMKGLNVTRMIVK